ncbi:kinocilin isoform X3 [Takifugu flavidus]|uniref:kinocilin isoform X3 n=1 Tax=Takifugu flavidus TaxID=433684 RepID=UPI00254423A9|nr:kinocilin isoform X3 [Takifugu flavidus]
MTPVSVGEYHGLRVGSALLGIVAGCIIIGVSRECDADAVGGIFLGAGGLGLLISIYPFIKAWLNINHVLPGFGNFRVHPAAASAAPDRPAETLRADESTKPGAFKEQDGNVHRRRTDGCHQPR